MQVLRLRLSKLPKPYKPTKLNFMKLSWSHNLFLRINATVGKNMIRDKIMIFGARVMVFVMFAVAILFGLYRWSVGDAVWITRYIEFLLVAFIISELISYLFALLFRHPRPRIEFPESRQLVHTVGSWKSFPSDHAIGSFSIAGALWYVADTPVALLVFLYLAACFVSFSRVYVGVHYPRDIVGGCVVAHVVLFLLPLLYYHIIEPIMFLW